MKDFFIRDCSQHENATIVSSFVVASKQIKPKRTGDLYIALTLADRTGQIEAKVWDNVARIPRRVRARRLRQGQGPDQQVQQ